VIARRVIVHGRVQGVFFRDTARREAERHGVAGWITNRDDGAVEAHAEGDDDAVEAFVTWMRSGPRRAEVQRAEVEDAPPQELRGFDVR
jgi:acylphosphatase